MNRKQVTYWLQQHSVKVGELTGLLPVEAQGLSTIHSNLTAPHDERLYATSISQALSHEEIEPQEEGELFLEHTLKTVMQSPDGQLFVYERSYDSPCCCAYCMFGLGGAAVGGLFSLLLTPVAFPFIFVMALLIPYAIGRRNRRDPYDKSVRPLSPDEALELIEGADSVDADGLKSLLNDRANFVGSTGDYHIYRTNDRFVSLSDRGTVRTYSDRHALKKRVELGDDVRMALEFTD